MDQGAVAVADRKEKTLQTEGNKWKHVSIEFEEKFGVKRSERSKRNKISALSKGKGKV